MKKIICILISALMCMTIAGCGSSTDDKPAQGSQIKSVDDVLNEKMSENDRKAGQSSVQQSTPAQTDRQSSSSSPVDIDLTTLSSTMVYSEVYNMIASPENYMGKRVRMKGAFAYSQGDNRYYYACIISDATACCAQGIEFILKDPHKFPEEYPEKGTEITVVGNFDTYNEGPNQYCQLIDAVFE